MGKVVRYHALPAERLALARQENAVQCSPERWNEYAPDTVVFVFGRKDKAQRYARKLGPGARVLTVCVEEGLLDREDTSAVMDPIAELRRLVPGISDEELARLEETESDWASSQAHLGPIPMEDVIDEEPP